MNADSITLNKNIKDTKIKSKGNKITLPVTGMSCAACAVSVESMLQSQEGVKNAGVNFANQTAWVDFNPTQTSLPKLQQAIQSIGYDLIIDEENATEKQQEA